MGSNGMGRGGVRNAMVENRNGKRFINGINLSFPRGARGTVDRVLCKPWILRTVARAIPCFKSAGCHGLRTAPLRCTADRRDRGPDLGKSI